MQVNIVAASATPIVVNAPCTSAACTVTAGGLPTGNVAVSATLRDASNQLLAAGTASATLSAAGPNTIMLPVGGFIGQVVLSANPLGFSPGTPATGTLSAAASDIDGNPITGTAPYANPLTLTNTDASGVVTLSTTTFSAPGQTIGVAYNGATTIKSAVLSASGSGVNPAKITSAGILLRNIYVADAGGNKVRVFSPGGAPTTIDPIASGFSFPQVLYFDAADNLYVGDGSTVRSFAPGSGSVNASAGGFTSVYTLAQDSAGRLFASDNNGQISVFSPAFSLSYYTGVASGLTNARYGTLSNGYFYIPDNTTGAVKVFSPVVAPSPPPAAPFSPLSFSGANLTAAISSQSGNVCVASPAGIGGDQLFLFAPSSGTPYATITLSLTGYSYNPSYCAFDAAGNVYSVNYSKNTITEYSAATQTLIATYTTAGGSYAIAFDPSGYMFVSDYNGNVVEVFRPPSPALVKTYPLGPGNPIFVAFGR